MMIASFIFLICFYLAAGYVYCMFKTAEYLFEKRKINIYIGSIFGLIWPITWMILTIQGIIALIFGERDKPE